MFHDLRFCDEATTLSNLHQQYVYLRQTTKYEYSR